MALMLHIHLLHLPWDGSLNDVSNLCTNSQPWDQKNCLWLTISQRKLLCSRAKLGLQFLSYGRQESTEKPKFLLRRLLSDPLEQIRMEKD